MNDVLPDMPEIVELYLLCYKYIFLSCCPPQSHRWRVPCMCQQAYHTTVLRDASNQKVLVCLQRQPVVDPFDEVFGSRGSSPDRQPRQQREPDSPGVSSALTMQDGAVNFSSRREALQPIISRRHSRGIVDV